MSVPYLEGCQVLWHGEMPPSLQRRRSDHAQHGTVPARDSKLPDFELAFRVHMPHDTS